MTALELAVSTGAFALSLAGIGFVWYVVRSNGGDMVLDEKRVAAVVRNAPYDRLDNVLVKRD